MKSIGAKIYTALAVMCILFLVIIYMNVNGLKLIGGYNNTEWLSVDDIRELLKDELLQ